MYQFQHIAIGWNLGWWHEHKCMFIISVYCPQKQEDWPQHRNRLESGAMMWARYANSVGTVLNLVCVLKLWHTLAGRARPINWPTKKRFHIDLQQVHISSNSQNNLNNLKQGLISRKQRSFPAIITFEIFLKHYLIIIPGTRDWAWTIWGVTGINQIWIWQWSPCDGWHPCQV